MQYGVFGKLPAHGDFIVRHLPQAFVDVWDEWLQCVVAGSRDTLGESWLDYYLTSPVWRFALESGVVDEHRWAGILVPSVDSVGRYFPLTIALPLANEQNLYSLISTADNWFEEIQSLALSSLQEQLNVDQLTEQLQGVMPPSAVRNCVRNRSGNTMVVGGQSPDFAALVELHNTTSGSVSLWGNIANENTPACSLTAVGLPTPDEYTSMLTGQWC
jgi:type VI secretion system protein ImpM